MFCDSFFCVRGTTWIEAAVVTQERADDGFVAGDYKNSCAAHQESRCVDEFNSLHWRPSFCHCCRNIEDSSALSNWSIPRRANKTTSRFSSELGKALKNSLATRFIRFLWTARRTFFLAITKPRRCLGSLFVLANSSRFLWEALASAPSKTWL